MRSIFIILLLSSALSTNALASIIYEKGERKTFEAKSGLSEEFERLEAKKTEAAKIDNMQILAGKAYVLALEEKRQDFEIIIDSSSFTIFLDSEEELCEYVPEEYFKQAESGFVTEEDYFTCLPKQ